MAVDDSSVGEIKENSLGTVYNTWEALPVCVYIPFVVISGSRPRYCGAVLRTSVVSSVLMVCVGKGDRQGMMYGVVMVELGGRNARGYFSVTEYFL